MAVLLTDTELERDCRLVEAHQAGDISAFGELYKLHYPRLLRFCQRKVRDAHLAEEIAQETFLKAYRAMPTMEGGRRFYPWLTVIASRLLIDHHRRADRVRPSADVDPGSVDDETLENLERQVDRDHILMALERVRVRHREVLRLRDYEDLSYEAIAARLGTSPSVVQSLLHRARQALRREYLAVTEHSMLAAALAPLLLLARRMRHRAARVAAWLPDAGSLGAPVAAAALAVSGAMAGAAPATPATAWPTTSESSAAMPAVAPLAEPQPAPADAGATTALPGPSKVVEGPPPTGEVWLGASGADEARAAGQDMPTRLDSGAGMVAADPATIVQDTIDAAAGLLGGN